MKQFDPFAPATREKGDATIIAGLEITQGSAYKQNYLLRFSDECIIVADGISDELHAEVAAQFAAETALWGYKLVRQRRFYWAEKPLLVKRIFRTTNLALWQKRREPGLESGVAASLGVIINVGKRICVGSVGNISVLLYREGLIAEVTPLDVSAKGTMNRALGFERLGLKPHIAVETFLSDDVVLMTTDSVMKYVSEDELRVVFDVAGATIDELNGALVHLMETAKKNGGFQDMSACLMKRIYTY